MTGINRVKQALACAIMITLSSSALAADAESSAAVVVSDNLAQRQATVTVVDDIGRYVTVRSPARRIVFLVENAMNTMYAVEGAGSIGGIGDIWKPEIKEPFFRAIDRSYDRRPKIPSDHGQVDMAALKAARPDLVVLWAADWTDATIKQIENEAGVPVYGVYYTKFSDIARSNDVFAKLIGKPKQGNRVTEIMAEYSRLVTERTKNLEDDGRPSVYWMWGDILGTAGLDSAINDFINMGGGKNVLEKASFEQRFLEHPVLTLEQIKELNPEVIYLWYNEQVDPEDIIQGTGQFAEWRDIAAVKNGRVHEIDDPFLYDAFTPRQPLTLMSIAKNLRPELFEDLNLRQQIERFFIDMYGVRYSSFAPVPGR